MKTFIFNSGKKCFMLFVILFSIQTIRAQCPACGAITFTVDLTATVDTTWSLVSQIRSGNCCADNNCIRFVVYLNPNADLVNFNVVSPSPSGSAFYSINCGSLTSIGTPVCVYGQSSVCITYCKPGGDSPTYNIIQTKTVKGSNDIAVRVGCSANMTIAGLSPGSISWTSIFPGAPGAYNSFLSCVSGCTLTTVTPTAIISPYIDYKVSGTPVPFCGAGTNDTIRVYVVPGLTANITPTNPFVCSGGSGSVVLTASVAGGAPPYTYTWSMGANTSTASVGAGTYTVSILDTAYSCPSVISTVTVLAITTPSAPLVSNNSPFCVGSTLSLTSSNSGGTSWNWTGPNSFTSNVQNPTIANAPIEASGTYSVTQTFNGCTGPPGTTNVTVSPIPAAPIAGSNSTLCAGSTLSLSANFSAGAIYTWAGPDGFTSNAQNPTIAAVTTSANGTYSVFVTIGGCSGPMGTVDVTVNPTPVTPLAASNSSICAGQTLSFTAGPAGGSYYWTGPASFTSTLQNPIIVAATSSASGTYSVTQTLLGCTSAFGTTTVTVSPLPSAPNASSNSTICSGQTLSLSASFTAGVNYNWTGPNAFSSNLQDPTIAPATVMSSGTYSVFAEMAGCSGPLVTLDVTVNPIPEAPSAANNSSICAGQTLSLTANPGGAIYSWTGPNGFTSNDQNPAIVGASTLASGNYSVTQTILGCTSSEAFTGVTINPIPDIPTGISNSPVCDGLTLSLTANPGGGIYNWSGPNSFTSTAQNPTLAATLAASGDYSVTITLLGCTSPFGIISATVGPVPAAPVVNANSPLCKGSTLNLSATFSPGVVYNWSGPDNFTSTDQNPIIGAVSLFASGVYTVYGSIDNCNGPQATVTVIVNSPPTVDAGVAKDTICASALSIPVNGTITGGGGSVWSTTSAGSFGDPNSLNTVYLISPADTLAGTITLILTSTGGCPAKSDTVIYKVLSAPFVDVGNDPIVCKNAKVIITTTISGVTNTGIWTSAGDGIFNPNAGLLNGYYIPGNSDTAAGSVKLFFETTNNKGCMPAKDSLLVTFIQSPIAGFINTNGCTSKPLNFSDQSAPLPLIANYSWDFGDGAGTSVSANPVYAYAASNTYTVQQIVTLLNGCTDTVKKEITVFNSPIANFTADNTCIGNESFFFDSSTVSDGSLIKWNWTFGDGSTGILTNPSHLYANTGSFAVNFTVTASNGCETSINKTVIVRAKPTAKFNVSATSVSPKQNVSFTDQSNAVSPAVISSWSWNFGNASTSGNQNVSTSWNDKGIYFVSLLVEDNFGCVDSVNGNVLVSLPPTLPTAFTPNEDGHNDLLFVKGGPFLKMSFSVYNNWGELLFKSDSQDKGWDGKYKGQSAPIGVYVWVLDASLYNGESFRKTGDITILK